MKRIIVAGAGGSAALNFTRSLRLAEEPFFLIGIDSSNHYLARAETDERHLVPRASEAEYLPVIQQIAAESQAEMIFAQSDPEVSVLSDRRDDLPVRTFLPDRRTVSLCQDKFETFRLWAEAGLRVPDTQLIRTPAELERFMADNGDVWLRPITGAAGIGALHTDSVDEARTWLDFNEGWGNFTIAAYLSPDSVTWQSIWNHGELVVAQGRRRLYWEFANRAPSGITGITGAAVTVTDAQVDEISRQAILAVDSEPHGIFSVDLTYGSDGVPNPTEINIGRFFTTHLFFTAAGLNMPEIAMRLAFGEEPPALERTINPLKPGLVWIRGVDKEPVLTDLDALKVTDCELQQRIARIRQAVPA